MPKYASIFKTSLLSSKHMHEQLLLKVVDPKNFTAQFYHLKVENPIFDIQ